MPVKAKGTKLQYGNNADLATSTTWTTVARVNSITPPKRMADKIPTTHLESDAEESIPGLPKSGEASAEVQNDPTVRAALDALFNIPKGWRVLYPDGSSNGWTGWLSEIGEGELQNGEIVTLDITISMTGEAEYDAGT